MPKKTLNPLSDIQKLVDQASSGAQLARTLASINAPARALKELNSTFASNNDLMKSLASASEIAKRLTQHSDLTAKIAESSPKIDLHLPNTAATVKASLPKYSPDIPAQRRTHTSVAVQEKSPEGSGQPEVQIDSAKDIGRMVRQLRERRKLSQQEFADLAGVGRRFLSELENGKPTLELGKVLQVTRAAGISLTARDRSL